MPPELRVQTRKCLVKRKHCRSPSFFRDREPSRTLLSFPRSTDGSWMRDPAGHERKTKRDYIMFHRGDTRLKTLGGWGVGGGWMRHN